MKHRRVPLQKFRYCETEISLQKNVLAPLIENRDIPLMQKIFRFPKFCQKEKGHLRNFSAK